MYKKVISRLAALWRHSKVMDSLLENIMLFKPEVQCCLTHPVKLADIEQAFPVVYLWMMYPLMVLLENIWKGSLSEEDGPSIETVEMCSVVERALNFMHTGNTSVLLMHLMSPLWTSQGLLVDGWPCFSKSLAVFGDERKATLLIKQWPFNRSTRGQSQLRMLAKHFTSSQNMQQ